MALFTGVNGVVKKASGVRQGVGGVVKTLTSGKVGVSGVVREFWGPVTPEAVEVEVLYIQGMDMTADGASSNTVNLTPSAIASYGSISFTSNSVTTVSNFTGKAIFLECCFYYVIGGQKILVTELNNSANTYSFPITVYISGSSSWRYWSTLLGVKYDISYGTFTKTLSSPAFVNYYCYLGIATTGSGTATERTTFNNITINGKSFTPKIVALPDGWAPSQIRLKMHGAEGFGLDTSGNKINAVNITQSGSAAYGTVTLQHNGAVITANKVGKGIWIGLRLYYVMNGIEYSFEDLNGLKIPYSVTFQIQLTSSGSVGRYYSYLRLPGGGVYTSTRSVTLTSIPDSYIDIGIGKGSAAAEAATLTASITITQMTINGLTFTPKMTAVKYGWTAPT